MYGARAASQLASPFLGTVICETARRSRYGFGVQSLPGLARLSLRHASLDKLVTQPAIRVLCWQLLCRTQELRVEFREWLSNVPLVSNSFPRSAMH